MNIKERKYLKERNKIKEENNSGGNLFEKRKNLVFIISLVIMSFSSFISVFAVSSYLYNSNEVSFNNSSSSSINSSNVQGAIDELYADAHNFEEMSGRVATLEDYFTLSGFPQGRYLVLNKGSDSDTSVRFMQSNKVRGIVGLYSSSSGATAGQMLISALDASQSQGKGVLNLEGNPVKVNGTSLNDTGWVAVSATNGTMRIRKKFNVVEFYYFTDKAINGTTTIATIPSEYRPTINDYPNRYYIVNPFKTSEMVTIGNDGTVKTGNNAFTSGTWHTFHETWIIN